MRIEKEAVTNKVLMRKRSEEGIVKYSLNLLNETEKKTS